MDKILPEDFHKSINSQGRPEINTEAIYKLKTFDRYSVDRRFTRIIQRKENLLEVFYI